MMNTRLPDGAAAMRETARMANPQLAGSALLCRNLPVAFINLVGVFVCALIGLLPTADASSSSHATPAAPAKKDAHAPTSPPPPPPAAHGSDSHTAPDVSTLSPGSLTGTQATLTSGSQAGVTSAWFLVNESLKDTEERIRSTNLVHNGLIGREARVKEYQQTLVLARSQRQAGLTASALANLTSIMDSDAPDDLKRTAMLELALIAQDEGQLARANQIFAQYLTLWPSDPTVPEVLLRQALLLRQMGLNNNALTKFYAVMTSALVLKADQFDYYQRLVLQAQTEVAETHFLMGKHTEAVDFYRRLLKQSAASLNKAQIQYKLVRTLAAMDKLDEVITQAHIYMQYYPTSPEQPEVRFYLASALKKLGRNRESLQQVLLLLQEQKERTSKSPDVWVYWQRRTGNEIANQLYLENDYLKALDIYLNIVALDASPAWQLPVFYQAGMCYEKLNQPIKAVEIYEKILALEKPAGPDPAPSLKSIFEMAKWRRDFLNWQYKAENLTSELRANSFSPPTDLPATMSAATK